MYKVIYLSSHIPICTEARDWLTNQDCSIICESGDSLINYPEDYDLGISFMYLHKIPAEQLHHRWINFHPAPLPNYRGRNVAYHAIINGETTFGATLHYVAKDFDTGDIIDVERFDILPKDTAGDLSCKAKEASLRLFQQYVPKFIAGEEVTGHQQFGGRYYKKEPISDYVMLTESQKRAIRAVTCEPNFFARVNIGGRIYRITPEDS